jgi:hypothetical protein
VNIRVGEMRKEKMREEPVKEFLTLILFFVEKQRG